MATCVVAVDGRTILSQPIEFSTSGEASLRLANGGVPLDDTVSLQLKLLQADQVLASVDVSPPRAGDDEDEWLSMPGARGHDRISLAVDVPGFTVCFDAAAATSSSRSTVLLYVRLVKQRTPAPAARLTR